MKTFLAMLDRIEQIIKGLVMAMVIILALMVFVYVVMRYFFNNPLVWHDEIVGLLIMCITYFGSALACATRGHIYVEIVEEVVLKYMPGLSTFWRVSIEVVSMAFFTVVIAVGIQLALESSEQITGVLHISFLWVYMILPLGALGMFLMSIKTIAREIDKAKAGQLNPTTPNSHI